MKRILRIWALPVLALLTLAAVATASASGTYDLSWWKVAGGGETSSSGGSYELGGTIGQPEAGGMSGGSYILEGGFWSLALTPPTFTISGNAGVAGATLSYNDGGPKTATSDSVGDYSFTVSSHWTNNVTPSKAGYTFAPVYKAYSDVLTDEVHQNYMAMIAGAPTPLDLYPPEGSQSCLSPDVGVVLLLTDLVRSGGSFNPASVSFTLDGADVMSGAEVLEAQNKPASHAAIVYVPPSNLAAGDHEVILTYPAPTESLFRHWSFTAADIQCQAASLPPVIAPAPLNPGVPLQRATPTPAP